MEGLEAATGATIGATRWKRLIPASMVVYIISFMDRTNISYAFAGIGQEFHVSNADQGFAGGIFFIGYTLFQIPGGWLATRWSAKKSVGVMILLWGAAAIWCGLSRSFNELVLARFVLGIAEGGVWPAILVLINNWFPVSERARAYGFWMTNLAIASIITQPLSGFIVGSTDWRTMLLIEGVLPFIIATPVWWLAIADTPRDAAWCSQAERDYIEESLLAEASSEPKTLPIRRIFTDRVVWQLVVVSFLIQVGFYGLNMWLPSLLKALTEAGFGAVGLIAALPYCTAIVFMWVNGSLADRNRRYQRHVLISLVVAAVSLVASVLIGQSFVALSVFFICLAIGGALSYEGPFWAAASRALPASAAGAAAGLINAVGNLGGFLGPRLGGVLLDMSGGQFVATAVALAASFLLAGVVMLTVRLPRGRGDDGIEATAAHLKAHAS
ncbi:MULTISPECIES: MFS transporter [unclassified Bradyrhizobium]|uniref:MFS transporter n=1 Tax=unclassified Bradyrhizobium TaxID=2631580 RepID=UPI0029166676|nr:MULTISPECIES: MFS transporter [unclassified Bradyrhizobium]